VARSLQKLRDALGKMPELIAAYEQQLMTAWELERALAFEWAKEAKVDTIQFDAKKFLRLKAAYRKACDAGETQFTFDGHELLVAYAKYLIQYLEGKFSR